MHLTVYKLYPFKLVYMNRDMFMTIIEIIPYV